MRIDSSTTGNGTFGTTSGAGLDASRDQFLKLFVAQLEHQNPLDPQDGADMVAQLAQFSSLEQQVQGNKRLDELVAAQDAAGAAGLAQLAGRDIMADVGTIAVDGATALPPIQIVGTPAAHGGNLVIHDASGAVVRTVPISAGPPPTAAWDGKDDHGAPLPAGTYTLDVAATGADGKAIDARPQVRARVDAVELGGEGPRLRIGNVKITPASVRSILGPQGDAS